MGNRLIRVSGTPYESIRGLIVKEKIGIVIIIASFLLFKWWGFLSLIVVLPFVGWADRYKSPFSKKNIQTTNWGTGIEFISAYPLSGKTFQALLLKLSKGQCEGEDLKEELSGLLSNLSDDGFGDKTESDQKKILNYLELFSKYFPNWKDEYGTIRKAAQA